MKTTPLPRCGRPGRRAFSLIEMIGVLAVIAITAAMLLPVLTKTTDSAVAGQETASLQSFGTALQNNILRTRSIPATTNWITVVAGETGLTLSNVAYTVRQQPRLLLVDTNGFGSLTLPYSQTAAGTPNPLTNSTLPRFMIVSSLGTALPALLGTNGFPSSTNFNALWNCPAGTVPTNSPWNTWTGKSSDVSVQRVSLSTLFARLTLNNSDPTNALYGIDTFAASNLAATNLFSAYYLIGTVFNLYMAGTNLEAAQVLQRDSSWNFSGGVWRSAPAPAVGTIVLASTADPHQSLVQTFCTNACNPWTRTYPTAVYNDFTNYMGLYMQYSSGGFTNKTLRTSINNCCNQLNYNDIPNLCNH